MSQAVIHDAAVLIDDKDSVRILSINRPTRRNALSLDVVDALAAEVRRAAADGTIRALVLTGVGGHFSAGGDADSIATVMDDPDPQLAVRFMRRYHDAIEAIWDSELPVVAAVAGVAYGGGFNLALVCDQIIAQDDARFCQVFLRRNVVPDMGGAYLLPRLVGLHRAKDLMLRTGVVSAPQAHDLGIVSEVVDDLVVDRAVTVAQEMTAGSRTAVAMTKRLVNTSTGGSLRDCMELEASSQALALSTDMARSGFAAFRAVVDIESESA
ncbi:enoyl-CoA hydratase/isomerase family protein [Rhodococcus sp. WS4]|nr:enoyl-CoA hydratase/isomerase family protein [Rhodococcus sp. WS4]